MNAPFDSRKAEHADAWRVQSFYDEMAEKAAERRRAKAMRHAVMFGVALGLIGSVAFLLQAP